MVVSVEVSAMGPKRKRLFCMLVPYATLPIASQLNVTALVMFSEPATAPISGAINVAVNPAVVTLTADGCTPPDSPVTAPTVGVMKTLGVEV